MICGQGETRRGQVVRPTQTADLNRWKIARQKKCFIAVNRFQVTQLNKVNSVRNCDLFRSHNFL